jgi:1,4-dihydroxy-2-naphthoate octaprenyltransferase
MTAGVPTAGSRLPAASLGDWLQATRPRTLPAAVVPVAVGAAVAHATGRVVWWHTALALVVSLALQVGTNLANDYSDGVRGTDEARVGPTRLVASGLAPPRTVKLAAFAVFALAAAAGLALALSTSAWLVAVGAAAIAAGWFYTGGRHPYGYLGLGEVFVFCFFGLVAVVGTVYVSCGELPALAFVAAVPVGLLAVALLVVNNLRDIPTDARSGKRTLAVLLGDRRTRRLYVGTIATSLLLVGAIAAWRPFALLALLAVVPAAAPVRKVLGGAAGRDLIAVLAMTGALQIAFGALLTLGIAL